MGKISLGAKVDTWDVFTPGAKDYVLIEGVADCIVVAVVYVNDGELKGLIGHFSSKSYDTTGTTSAARLNGFIDLYKDSEDIRSISVSTNYLGHTDSKIQKIKNTLNPEGRYQNEITVCIPFHDRKDYATIYYFTRSNRFSSMYSAGWEKETDLGNCGMAPYPSSDSNGSKNCCVLF